MSKKAFDIEKASFEVIDAEVGNHGYSAAEWPIVRRVIHATADFDFAVDRDNKLVFHSKALGSAFDAIRNKCTIVTDVEMVIAAINKKSVSDLGLETACYISDKEVIEKAKSAGMTRSEVAMRHAAADMDGGIVAVGNAPTALYEVLKMVKEEVASPALIIGIPVGFVSAVESKQELLRTASVPFITNTGRKGGSSVAGSIINAIMLLYQSRQLSS
jgi:precorrin-8X/cobalt-precorrin-8 methylmutase